MAWVAVPCACCTSRAARWRVSSVAPLMRSSASRRAMKAGLEPPALSGCARTAASRYARRTSFAGASIVTPRVDAAARRRSASSLTVTTRGVAWRDVWARRARVAASIASCACAALVRFSASEAAASPWARRRRPSSVRSCMVGEGTSPPITRRSACHASASGALPRFRHRVVAHAAARRAAACAPGAVWYLIAISQKSSLRPAPSWSPCSAVPTRVVVILSILPSARTYRAVTCAATSSCARPSRRVTRMRAAVPSVRVAPETSISYSMSHGHVVGLATTKTAPCVSTATVCTSFLLDAPPPSRKPRCVRVYHSAWSRRGAVAGRAAGNHAWRPVQSRMWARWLCGRSWEKHMRIVRMPPPSVSCGESRHAPIAVGPHMFPIAWAAAARGPASTWRVASSQACATAPAACGAVAASRAALYALRMATAPHDARRASVGSSASRSSVYPSAPVLYPCLTHSRAVRGARGPRGLVESPIMAVGPCCPRRRAASRHSWSERVAGARGSPAGSSSAAAARCLAMAPAAWSRCSRGMLAHRSTWAPSWGPGKWHSGHAVGRCRRSSDRRRSALPVAVGSLMLCLGLAPGVAPLGRSRVEVVSASIRTSHCVWVGVGSSSRIRRVMPSMMRRRSERSARTQLCRCPPASHMPRRGGGVVA